MFTLYFLCPDLTFSILLLSVENNLLCKKQKDTPSVENHYPKKKCFQWNPLPRLTAGSEYYLPMLPDVL